MLLYTRIISLRSLSNQLVIKAIKTQNQWLPQAEIVYTYSFQMQNEEKLRSCSWESWDLYPPDSSLLLLYPVAFPKPKQCQMKPMVSSEFIIPIPRSILLLSREGIAITEHNSLLCQKADQYNYEKISFLENMSQILRKNIQVKFQCVCMYMVCVHVHCHQLLILLIILSILFSIMFSFTDSSLLNNAFDVILSYSKVSTSIYFLLPAKFVTPAQDPFRTPDMCFHCTSPPGCLCQHQKFNIS